MFIPLHPTPVTVPLTLKWINDNLLAVLGHEAARPDPEHKHKFYGPLDYSH